MSEGCCILMTYGQMKRVVESFGEIRQHSEIFGTDRRTVKNDRETHRINRKYVSKNDRAGWLTISNI